MTGSRVNQSALFADENAPCSACKGTGQRDTRHTDPLAVWNPANPPACFSCGGSGRAKDQPNPETMEIPFK